MVMNKNIITLFFSVILVVLLLLISTKTKGQSLTVNQELLSMHSLGERKKPYSFAKQNRNEVQMILSGLFLFYKQFISSQDAQHCSFTPSCSEFALRSIQEKGILIGSLMSFDRLSRCNGLSPENYQRNSHNHLLIDPVE